MSVSVPVVAGQPFTASIPTPPGPPVGLGARVEVPVSGAIVSAWQPCSIPAPGDTCYVTLDGVLTAGLYVIHWMTEGPVSTYDTYQPIQVVGTLAPSGVDAWPQAAPEDVRPEADDVALLERTRTVESDTGEEAGVFTAKTRPTVAQVDALIDQATDDILDELPYDAMVDPIHYRQIRRAITFYTAVLIEGSYYREQSQERGGPLWQSEYQEALKNVQARVVEDYAEKNRLTTLEPHDSPGYLLA